MAKPREDYNVVLKAATGLITQLTMLTSALASGQLGLGDFWEGFSEAIDSFVPEGPASGNDLPASPGGGAPPPDVGAA